MVKQFILKPETSLQNQLLRTDKSKQGCGTIYGWSGVISSAERLRQGTPHYNSGRHSRAVLFIEQSVKMPAPEKSRSIAEVE
jgi:hypothetical protein